jgi:hypothetical protein
MFFSVFQFSSQLKIPSQAHDLLKQSEEADFDVASHVQQIIRSNDILRHEWYPSPSPFFTAGNP